MSNCIHASLIGLGAICLAASIASARAKGEELPLVFSGGHEFGKIPGPEPSFPSSVSRRRMSY